MKTVKSFLIIALLSMSGLAYSQSGWYAVTDSVNDLYLTKVQMTSAQTGYASGEYYLSNKCGAFMKTTNGGQNWQRNDYTYVNCIDLYFFNDMTGFMLGYSPYGGSGFYSGHIYKTTDGAATWSRHDSISGGKFFCFYFYNSDTGMIAGKWGEARTTTNGGVNWNYTGVFTLWGEPQYVWPLNSYTWIVGYGNGIYKTTNFGLNWNSAGSGPTYAISFINSEIGFGASDYGIIFKTTDSGNSWSIICQNNISSMWPKDIKFVNALTGYMCGYNYGNIYKTTNGGYNWISQSVYPGHSFYTMSFLNSLTGYAGSMDGRIFKTTSGGSVFVSNISNEIPDRFELGQNYPNPFNQFSIIDFKLQMKSDIVLKVFDAAGRVVQTLVDETLAPGTYRVRFDGSGLSSGLYYYRMTAGGKLKAVRKMVMMK